MDPSAPPDEAFGANADPIVASPSSSNSSSTAPSASPVSDDTMLILGCTVGVFFFGIVFRLALHPRYVGATCRHVVEFFGGVVLIVFCYGSAGLTHLAVFTGLNYVTMKWAPPRWSHLLVAAEAFGYLSLLHIERMVTDYGGWTFTVTTTIMMTLQRTTSLAFALHDSRSRRQEANRADDDGDKNEEAPEAASPWEDAAYRKLPTALEYFSYVFSFHGVLIGPICFYHDYKRFVEGTGYKDPKTGKYPMKPTPILQSPHPMGAIFVKLLQCAFCGYLMVSILPKLPLQRLVDEEFIAKHSKAKRFAYFLVAATLVRFRYYFGWILGDITNNSAGFGYSHTEEKSEKQRWTLLENMNIIEIESATSPKMLIERWNKLSAIWLRHLVYSRHPAPSNLYLTYVVSSLWHGFYPGYYVFFATLALITVAARKWRRCIRPRLIGIGVGGVDEAELSRRQSIYDTYTWLATKVIAAYFTVPFVLLSLDDIFRCYGEMFWFGHVAALLIIFCVPDAPASVKSSTTSSINNVNERFQYDDVKSR